MEIKDNVLMKSQIFSNAYHIYQGGLIKVDTVSATTIYFVVQDLNSGKEHNVTLGYDINSQTTGLTCTCTIQSLKIKHKPLCSHMVAAILYSGFQLGRPKRRRKE